MASPFYWAGRMTYEFGRRQIAESTDWAIFWTGVALILAVMMLDLRHPRFRPASGPC